MRSVFLFLLVIATSAHAQVLSPSENLFDKKMIRNGRQEMTCFVANGEQWVEISSFVIDVSLNNKHLSVYTSLKMFTIDEPWVDTSIADATTFKPHYRSSFNQNRSMVLHYGNDVTGYYYDKKTKKRTAIKESVKESVFDSYLYPYLLGLLPLTSGYHGIMPVYEYKPGNASNVKKTRIEEVKSNQFTSALTGEHKVWQVSVFEEATNDKYEYYIDKSTRRLWKVDIFTNSGQRLLMIDKEIDFNPFTTTFDKESTMKLIKSGKSVISGTAFARDNENEGLLKGMAILNINKKQYARPGTSVILIPYTDFFKEWIKLNESARKKGRAIPLPKEAVQCIKVATVYDEKGNFEFVNLMPGDYLLYTEFGYVHTTSRTEVVGYTDTYINGMFQGSSANTQTYSYGVNAAATIKKVVTIKKEGETVSIKLKKTL